MSKKEVRLTDKQIKELRSSMSASDRKKFDKEQKKLAKDQKRKGEDAFFDGLILGGFFDDF